MSLPEPRPARADRFADLFTPKLVTTLREGYSLAALRDDAVAGLTVAVVALPLAMAIAIASGVPPERGLYTAIVAGFLISALGGSRFQIGGPTAAFIVVVFQTVERHGYEGLVLATIIAGLILVAVGLLRLGTYIKYIPYPVIVGFTAGIAVSIFVSQIAEILGVEATLPAEVPAKIGALAAHLGEAKPATIAVALLSLAMILGLRRFRPRWPGFLIAVALAAAVVAVVGLDVATVGSRFGGVPSGLPAPSLPRGLSLDQVRAVLPDALTIAFLAGIESLLSAVVADGMTGRRHRSNPELVAQGIANVASAVFGGICATGAIARTATNIRAGGRTPIAGMLHAVFVLAFMVVAAPLLSSVPLAALAAILVVVAWNIAEFDHLGEILAHADWGDRAVLIVTFVLTVAFDLTVAIEVGVVLAAILFMHRMAEAVEVEVHEHLIDEDVADGPPGSRPDYDPAALPDDVMVYRINGPFFFGAAQRVAMTLERIGRMPRRLVLDLSAVPFVDATASAAMRSFVDRLSGTGTELVLAGARPTVRRSLTKLGLKPPVVRYAGTIAAGVADAAVADEG